MAKLKAPLLSLGASGQIGKSIVYFPWKGLDAAREYVVPSNPKTAAQNTQRGYMTACIAKIHSVQGYIAAECLDADDIIAYALLASCEKTPRTWFNAAVKQWLDQHQTAGLKGCIFSAGGTTPGGDALVVTIRCNVEDTQAVTTGDFWYGTSKTAMTSKIAGVKTGDKYDVTIPDLTTGIKYYWQFRPTAHASYVGTKSGIYYGTPT